MPTHVAPYTAAGDRRPLMVAAALWCRSHIRFSCALALMLVIAHAVQLFLGLQYLPPRRPPPPSAPLGLVSSPNDTDPARLPMLVSLFERVLPSQLQQQHVPTAATSTEQPIIPRVSATLISTASAESAAAEQSSSSAGMNDRPSASTAAPSGITNGGGRKMVVLFWTTFWGDSFEVLLKSGLPPSARCSRLCELAYDRRRLLDADAVIFHAPELRQQRLPDKRKADQLWVLFTLEAPRHGYVSSVHNGVFNLSMTYRSDSDIEVGYGHTEALDVATAPADNLSSPAALPPPTYVEDSLNFANRKPYAYWVVSNCGDPRMAYVRELAKHIRVDVFGKCGPANARPCNGSASVSPDQNCVEELGATYAFYLSFENSLCTDYITEKLWRVLASPGGAIPVVIGAQPSRYAQLAPPSSYIHAESFASPRDLAAHLMRVASSHDLFASYHRWRKSYRAHVGWLNELALGVCHLCESAHDGVWHPPRPAKPDLSGWFLAGCRAQWPREKQQQR